MKITAGLCVTSPLRPTKINDDSETFSLGIGESLRGKLKNINGELKNGEHIAVINGGLYRVVLRCKEDIVEDFGLYTDICCTDCSTNYVVENSGYYVDIIATSVLLVCISRYDAYLKDLDGINAKDDFSEILDLCAPIEFINQIAEAIMGNSKVYEGYLKDATRTELSRNSITRNIYMYVNRISARKHAQNNPEYASFERSSTAYNKPLFDGDDHLLAVKYSYLDNDVNDTSSIRVEDIYVTQRSIRGIDQSLSCDTLYIPLYLITKGIVKDNSYITDPQKEHNITGETLRTGYFCKRTKSVIAASNARICENILDKCGLEYEKGRIRGYFIDLIKRNESLDLFGILKLIKQTGGEANMQYLDLLCMKDSADYIIAIEDSLYCVRSSDKNHEREVIFDNAIEKICVFPLRDLVRIFKDLGIDIERMEAIRLSGDGKEFVLDKESNPSRTQTINVAWFLSYTKSFKKEIVNVILLSFCINILALVVPLGTRAILDGAVGQKDTSSITSYSSIMILCIVLSLFAKVVRSSRFGRTANQIDFAVRSDLMDEMLACNQLFFDNRPVGQITYYFSLLDKVRDFFVNQSITLTIDTGFLCIYIIIMFAMSKVLALVVLTSLPVLFIIVYLSSPVYSLKADKAVEKSVNYHSFMTEVVGSIQMIKSQAAESFIGKKIRKRYGEYTIKDTNLKIFQEYIGSVVGSVQDFYSVFLVASGLILVIEGSITIGTYFAFTILSGMVIGPVIKLATLSQQLQLTLKNLSVISEITKHPKESNGRKHSLNNFSLQSRISFKGIYFSYPAQSKDNRLSRDDDLIQRKESEIYMVNDLNMDIDAGSFNTIIGLSGSGKSTALKLLPRFYEFERGDITIDGISIKRFELQTLRKNIAVVPQDNILLDGTIADNLTLGSEAYTVDEILESCVVAQCKDFILDLEYGLDTNVGERGSLLSGGQRQRIAIARAILRKPRVLILDEATSALDPKTEMKLISELKRIRDITILFITHRVRNCEYSDYTFVFDKGCVVEHGMFKKLSDDQFSLYSQLMQAESYGSVYQKQ